MGSQLSVEVSTGVGRSPGGFLLVEGDSPFRLDLIATLRQLFPAASLNYLYKSDQADLTATDWGQFELVLVGNSRYSCGSSLWPEGLGLQRTKGSFPLVVMLTENKCTGGECGSALNADMCLPYDVSVSEFAAQLEIAREARRLLSEYPLSLPGWGMREVLHNSENAVIFLAENNQGEQVAIKRFKFDVSGMSASALEYFMAEAHTLMSQHDVPVLVKLLDAGVVGGRVVYLMMEYLPGVILKDRLQGCPEDVDLERRLAWFQQITEALVVIHESGLLHRDLKSSNVLMREDDSPAVLDLGIEAQLLSDCGLLNADEIYCTPSYVSPERIIGEPASVASDLYALGILFYEMLIGEKPFRGGSLSDVLMGHMFNPVPPLPDHLAAYQSLLSKLLVKSSEHRLRSARSVLSELDKINSSYL